MSCKTVYWLVLGSASEVAAVQAAIDRYCGDRDKLDQPAQKQGSLC